MTRRGTTNRNARGSSYSRRIRKQWLLDTFGDGNTAICSFDGCDTVLDFDTITADRYPIPGAEGGTYKRNNIRPACGTCNSKDGHHLMMRRKNARLISTTNDSGE